MSFPFFHLFTGRSFCHEEVPSVNDGSNHRLTKVDESLAGLEGEAGSEWVVPHRDIVTPPRPGGAHRLFPTAHTMTAPANSCTIDRANSHTIDRAARAAWVGHFRVGSCGAQRSSAALGHSDAAPRPVQAGLEPRDSRYRSIWSGLPVVTTINGPAQVLAGRDILASRRGTRRQSGR